MLYMYRSRYAGSYVVAGFIPYPEPVLPFLLIDFSYSHGMHHKAYL